VHFGRRQRGKGADDRAPTQIKEGKCAIKTRRWVLTASNQFLAKRVRLLTPSPLNRLSLSVKTPDDSAVIIPQDVPRPEAHILKLREGITRVRYLQLRKDAMSASEPPTLRGCIYIVDIAYFALINDRIGQAGASNQGKEGFRVRLKRLSNRLIAGVIRLVALAPPIMDKAIWLNL
jgi:hypothetical protein